MTDSGRTEVANDVKFGRIGASFIELYLWSKFGDPSSRRRDDGDDDDDGVRGLCHKRLRQPRWARALKIEQSINQSRVC